MTTAALRAFINTVHRIVPPDVIKLGQERRRQDEINRGQLRIGTPGDWYATIRWSDQAWNVLWPITFWR